MMRLIWSDIYARPSMGMMAAVPQAVDADVHLRGNPMRKRVVLFLLLFLFQGVEAYCHEVDLTVTIYTDRLIYSSGETMKLFVGANNKDLPIEVDAYIAMQAPDGTLYLLTDITSTTFVRFNPLDSGTIKPLATVLLPSGLILPDSPILTSSLPLPMMPMMTEGICTWFLVLTEAGTFEIIGMSTTSFMYKKASSTGEKVYVVNRTDKTVSAIDTLTSQVIATTPLDAPRFSGAVVSLDGRFLYVTNFSEEVIVVDLDKFRELTQIPVGRKPLHTYLSPDGRHVWIGNDGVELETGHSSASVIDVSINKEVKRVMTGNGHRKIAFTDSSPYEAYVSNINDGTVSVIDGTDFNVVTTIPVGTVPHGSDFGKLSKHIYQGCGDGKVYVIGTIRGEQHQVVKVITVGTSKDRPEYIHFDKRGRYGFVLVPTANYVSVIDATIDEEIKRITVGDYPDNIRFTSRYAFVSNVRSSDVSVIDIDPNSPTFLTLIKNIPVGRSSLTPFGVGNRGLVITPDEKRVYAPNSKDNTISVIDVDTLETVVTIPVGNNPGYMTMVGDRRGADLL